MSDPPLIIPLHPAHWCSRLTRCPLKAETTGSSPVCATTITKVARINFSGLSFLPSGVHNCTDTQTSAGNQGSVPAIEIPNNLDGVAEIAKPKMYVSTKPGGDNP